MLLQDYPVFIILALLDNIPVTEDFLLDKSLLHFLPTPLAVWIYLIRLHMYSNLEIRDGGMLESNEPKSSSIGTNFCH